MILSLKQFVIEWPRSQWKTGPWGNEVVHTNGTFDLFHAGHLDLLLFASRWRGLLVVSVNTDASIARLRGRPPLMPLSYRLRVLDALPFVDVVIPFREDQDDPVHVIGAVRPTIHVKGEEYRGKSNKEVPERYVVEGMGGRMEYCPRAAWTLHATDIINEIRRRPDL